jgi:hypothetical protein
MSKRAVRDTALVADDAQCKFSAVSSSQPHALTHSDAIPAIREAKRINELSGRSCASQCACEQGARLLISWS